MYRVFLQALISREVKEDIIISDIVALQLPSKTHKDLIKIYVLRQGSQSQINRRATFQRKNNRQAAVYEKKSFSWP